MKKQGSDVQILTNRYPISLPAQDYLEGIKIVRYFFFHSPLNYIRNRRPDLFFAWLIMKPVTLFKLLIHFFRTRPDVVNLHFPDQQLFECYLLKLMFRFKLIISLHGNEVERMGILKKRTLRYYFYEKLFYSVEQNADRMGYHIHLMFDAFLCNREHLAFALDTSYDNITYYEPINDKVAVSRYVTKYMKGDQIHYNYLGCRVQASNWEKCGRSLASR